MIEREYPNKSVTHEPEWRFGVRYCWWAAEDAVRFAALARRKGFKVKFIFDKNDPRGCKCAFELLDPFKYLYEYEDGE